MAICRLTGTVVDSDLVPIEGATVRARTIATTLDEDGHGIAVQDLTTTTAADGTWTISLEQGLSCQIDVTATGLYADIQVPAETTVDISTLTLYARGSLTPATIISTTGPTMGGDLYGSSPSPTVVGFNGTPLYGDTPHDGEALVYVAADDAYRSLPVTTGPVVETLTAGTGVTLTGTATDPIVGLSSGTAASIAGSVQGAAVIAAINASSETPKIAAAQIASVAQAQVTGLVADLAAKRATATPILQSEVTGLETALSELQATADKGQPNGYASLDGDGLVPIGLLPPEALGAHHAATHAVGGDDPVSPASIGAAEEEHMHAEADITGLVEDLADRVLTTDSRLSDARTPTAHTHAGADVTSAVPRATVADDGVTSASGTAPLTLSLAAKALTGSVATFGPLAAGAVPASGGGSAHYLRADGTWATPPGTVLTPASTVVTETAFGQGSAVGSSALYARADHTHGTPAAPSIPSAATSVESETSYGITPAVGTSAAYAREDHTHGTPAAIAAASSVAAETSFGLGSVVGVSAAYARADHLHGTPALPDAAAGTKGAVALAGDLGGTAASPTVPGLSGKVPTTRTISTTAPLAGGGDLSTDRTLSVAEFDDASAGIVPASGGGTANFLRADGTWQPATVGGVTSVGATSPLSSSGGTTPTITLGMAGYANGGTNATTPQGAMDNLAGAVTSGQYLRGNGSHVVMSAIQAGDVPTLNQSTTGTASNVTGTVAVANGGTGSGTAAGARGNLGAAASGANSDITSLSGLSTALGITVGGTGSTTGSITGSGDLTFTAGGSNRSVRLTPSGSGHVITDGRLGVGTENPSATLTVNGSARFGGAGDVGNYYLRIADRTVGDSDVDFVITSYTAGSGAKDLMTFDTSAARVGIGTTDPTATLDVNSDFIRLRAAKTPASASASGSAGDICWDASYLYICIATDTWRRIAHNTW